MIDLVMFDHTLSKKELLDALNDADSERLAIIPESMNVIDSEAAEAASAAEAARVAFMREMSISFVELCIFGALWGMFGVARERLFKEGVLLTKEQFIGIGFKTMLPPETLLRVGMAGWHYSIVQEPPLIPSSQSTGRPARENVRTIGLG